MSKSHILGKYDLKLPLGFSSDRSTRTMASSATATRYGYVKQRWSGLRSLTVVPIGQNLRWRLSGKSVHSVTCRAPPCGGGCGRIRLVLKSDAEDLLVVALHRLEGQAFVSRAFGSLRRDSFLNEKSYEVGNYFFLGSGHLATTNNLMPFGQMILFVAPQDGQCTSVASLWRFELCNSVHRLERLPTGFAVIVPVHFPPQFPQR
jgi:hypothetical protein